MDEIIIPYEIWSIDRLDGETAILESDSGRRAEFWIGGLPENAGEGDIVRELPDGSLILDEDETAKRRGKNADLFRSLIEE